MTRVSLKDIDRVTRGCLVSIGVPDSSIDIFLDTIHYANRRGISTHGVGRLPLYVKKIKAGHFEADAPIETVTDFGAMAILDGNNGFGQIVAYKAMKTAISKAKEFGVSVVGVRNSNNFGTAGYYGNMATEAGMAAIIFANAAPAIAPTGGTKPIFGTNPMCYAFPGSEAQNPVILDMATTVVARGKIRLAAKNGEKIPLTWAVDADGNPTDDPKEALKGTLCPIAGHKGYGISAFIDLFAGLLTGSASTGGVKPLSDMTENSGNGHLFVVIDVSRFMTNDELAEKMSVFYKAVKYCGEEDRVLLPGERGFIQMKKNVDSVEIPDKQLQEINALAESLGVDVRLKEM